MEKDLPSYYESNLKILKKHHQKTWALVTSLQDDFIAEICRSTDGKPNLKVFDENGSGFYLHASSDPELEIPQFLDMITKDSTSFVALLGMGLGYTPRAILKQRSYLQRFVLFELEPNVFKLSLKLIDLSEMLSDPRLLLCVGADPDIENLLKEVSSSLMTENIQTLKHLPSFEYNKEYATLENRLSLSAGEFRFQDPSVCAFR